MKKPKLLLIITIALALVTIVNFFWHVFLYRHDIFSTFNSTYWTIRYQESQWVVPNSKNPIGDDGLYMYAGYRYMQGDDPTLLNAEYPPLGKYIIGFFEVTTGYTGVFSLFFAMFTLFIFYLFNKTFFSSSFLALIPVTIFSFDPLFIAQIRAAYLDTLYLSFLLLGFLLYSKKKYFFAGLAFGAFMAVKAPFLILLIYATIFIYEVLQKKIKIKKMLCMILSMLFIFLLSYTATFFHGHGIIYFIKVQKYIIHFYATGAKAVVGAVFPMIFFDTWFTWYNTVQKIAEWSILWPLAGIGGLVASLFYLKKKTEKIAFQLLWVGIYSFFLMFTPLFPRYLLLLLPFLYNLSIWSISNAIKKRSS